MGSIDAINGIFCFDELEFDARALELRRRGERLKLEGQPLRVLALLLEHPRELVTREDLRRRLWPGNTIVDFEHSINAAVKRLREALDDSAETPRFIETLPRRGYRFICPVEEGSAHTASTLRTRRFRRPAVAVGILVAGLLTLGAVALRAGWLGSGSADGHIAIAVLPLKNLSGDAAQDYYAEGISEALITELGKIGRLQVLSFQTLSRYKQTPKALPEIARELSVEALLEGSVVRSGDRVRITATLFQANPERRLLSETYEFDARDVLAVQAEVARDVASRIRVKLTSEEQARLAISRRVDPEAYEAYLLGRTYSSRAAEMGALRAKEYYEKAIAKDPTYAPAYAGLAEFYARFGRRFAREPNGGYSDVRLQTRQWAQKALALDDGLAEAHTALARTAQQEWDWSGAEREYRRAIEVNPSYALARIWYARYLYALERTDEAVVQAKRAQQLDPASSLVNAWAGTAYFLAGKVDDATATWRRALELEPGYADTSLALARSYIQRGMYDQAIAVLQKALTFNAQHPFLLGALAHAHARSQQRGKALKVISEMAAREHTESLSPFGMIWAYAGLNDADEAFARLERTYEQRLDRMVWIKVDPLLAPLRSDPRFQDLIRRMNMPVANIASLR